MQMSKASLFDKAKTLDLRKKKMQVEVGLGIYNDVCEIRGL